MKQVVALAGTTNIGKTGWLVLMAEQNPDLPFYILDTQYRVKTVAQGVTRDGEVPANVTVGVVDEAEGKLHPIEQALNFMNTKVKPALGKGTMVYAVDMVGKIWEWAQDYYVYTKTGKHQSEVNQSGKNDFNPGIDERHSWARIKGWHNSIVYAPINSPSFERCHVLLTAGIRDMRLDASNPIADKDQDIIDMWKHFGQVLPESEKHLTYEVYTMLGQDFIMMNGLKRKHRLTLVKDMKRGRNDEVDFFRRETLEETDGMWDVWGTYCKLRGIEDTKLGEIA